MINERKVNELYTDVVELRYLLRHKKKLDESTVIDVSFGDLEGNIITRMDNEFDDIALRLSQTLLEEINVEIAKYIRKYPELESNVDGN